MKNKISIIQLVLMAILLSGMLKVNAQVSGYGVGTLGSAAISSGINYFDDVRAEVDNISGSGSPTATINLNATYNYGTFNNNDMALIIQMIGGTIGTHQNVRITGSGSSWTITAITGNILSYTPNSGGAGNVVQLIKIREYSSLSVIGGVITCNQWDGHTGGVLCFVVSGNLQVSGAGGLFTVAGCGFRAVEDGVATFASGGAGGTGATSISTTSMYGPPASYWMTPNCSTAVYFPTNGGYGGVATSGGSRNNNSGGGTTWGGSTYQRYAVMADPGYYQTGFTPPFGGGAGAWGGGKGGNGAGSGYTTPSPCSNTGGTGANGADGDNGGNAGKGGNGGGLMIIKVGSTCDLSSLTDPNQVVFQCSGQNGQNGGPGGNGGVGGAGGAGGRGCCISSVATPQGCPGGDGDSGPGGEGGDAGDGGDCGYIWIAGGGGFNTNASHIDNNFDVSGGDGGVTGLGGWGGYNTTPSPIIVTNECTSTACTTGGGGGGGGGGSPSCNEYCQSDYAMGYLECNAHSALVTGSNDVEFWSGYTAGTGNLVSKFFSNNSKLESYFNYNSGASCWDKYIAYFYDAATSLIIFKEIAGNISILYPFWPIVDISKTTQNGGLTCGSSSISYPVEIYFNDASILLTLLSYEHASATSPAYITESYSKKRVCYVDACTTAGTQANNSSPSRTSTTSRNGQHGRYGSVTRSTTPPTTRGAIVDFPSSWKRSMGVASKSDVNPLGANLYPNPTNKEAWIELQTDKSAEAVIKIFDISGKVIFQQNAKLNQGQNKLHINIDAMNIGTYILELETPNGTSRFNLMIE